MCTNKDEKFHEEQVNFIMYNQHDKIKNITTKEEMKSRILWLLDHMGNDTLHLDELWGYAPGSKGNMYWYTKRNLIHLWSLSELGFNSLLELSKEKKIIIKCINDPIYFLTLPRPAFPLAKKDIAYKTPHLLPGIIKKRSKAIN